MIECTTPLCKGSKVVHEYGDPICSYWYCATHDNVLGKNQYCYGETGLGQGHA